MNKIITIFMLMGALIPAGAQAQALSLDRCYGSEQQQADQCLEAQERRGV